MENVTRKVYALMLNLSHFLPSVYCICKYLHRFPLLPIFHGVDSFTWMGEQLLVHLTSRVFYS